MHAVRKQDDEQLAIRIDPDGGSGESGVSVRPFAEVIPRAVLAFTDFPPQRTSAGGARREQSHRGVAHDPDSVVRAEVEHHLCEDREIVRGAEEAGMTRHTTERPRIFVVHFSTKGIAARRRDFGWGDSVCERIRRPESGAQHAERREHPVAEEHIQLLLTDPLDDHAEQVGPEIGVDEPRSRPIFERHVVDELLRFLGRVRVTPQVAARRQPTAMHQQLANGDFALEAARERGQVVFNLFVEIEPALVEQDHRGRRSPDHLGQRRKIVDAAIGIDTGTLGGPSEFAEPLLPDHCTLAAYNDSRAGISARRDSPLHDAIDRLQPIGRHADFDGCLDRQSVDRNDGQKCGDDERSDHAFVVKVTGRASRELRTSWVHVKTTPGQGCHNS